ncbi:DEKNAAC101462 [Brettanomyces naardenensis]|uniref:DEKNAAC101462 n=1 Tax=Brettanomyces naardenensis TaxID=13370 RepID=A0A448YI00_BRENA|nr:DEKNAAC101462 [Brettanomyces naardenensis]
MVLEATMIVIDNSEYMRNGDYLTSRYQAQLDTVELIFRRKTSANPESTVGLLTMAGESTRVISNLTTDYGKLLSGLHEARIGGETNLVNGIQVACLALKNRQNKNQRQRVVVFLGSPVDSEDSTLDKLAKRLKKNNVSIDFVNFGEEQTNTSKLERFIGTVNNNNSSHLVTVPPGPYLLYEQVDRSPILRDQDVSGGSVGETGGASGVGGADDFGLDDPNMDPELALAIRLSLEEERARQEREAATSSGKDSNLNTVDEKVTEDKPHDTEEDPDKMDESK